MPEISNYAPGMQSLKETTVGKGMREILIGCTMVELDRYALLSDRSNRETAQPTLKELTLLDPSCRPLGMQRIGFGIVNPAYRYRAAI